MSALDARTLVQNQRVYFKSGATHDLDFRLAKLQALRQAIHDFEEEILQALKKDLNKPAYEAFASEIALCYDEIAAAIKNLKSWARPEGVPTPLTQWIGKSSVYREPRGVVMIIGPWNYPFQLLIAPMVGAIAAGNCVVLKPSEISPHTSAAVLRLISKTFAPEYVSAVEGGVETSRSLLEQKFDYIFFTGGTAVGKVVMTAAAQHLTPVTLELGGKSPCIVDEDVALKVAAKRIVWGKFYNAGQTCVAPDYLLVHKKIKETFLKQVTVQIQQFFGENPAACPDYARIVNQRHFERLKGLLGEGKTLIGGKTDAQDLYISPTVLDQITLESKIMEEEIFGPILPVLEFTDLDEVIEIIGHRPNPLALYLFSKNKDHQNRIVQSIPFGGGCINDTLMHLGNPNLPFGGVGDSGMGAYHGRYGFETFSHLKSVLNKATWFDPSFRYQPYAGKMGLIKKLMK